MMPSSRLGCPLSLKTPNMGNPDSLEDLGYDIRVLSPKKGQDDLYR